MEGLDFTSLFLGIAGLDPGSLILDAGCGDGASLGTIRQAGHRALGVDLEGGESDKGEIIVADIKSLPFDDSSLDGVFCQCVLSICGDHARAIHEFARAVKPGGRLLVTDIMGIEGADAVDSPFVLDEEELKFLLVSEGFDVTETRDYTVDMRTWALQKIWDGEDTSSPQFRGLKGKAWRYTLLAATRR